MRRSLVAGNWKMNGNQASATQLIEGILAGRDQISEAELAVFPPFVYLASIAEQCKDSDIRWGAQNVSKESNGAYTGEISVDMLLDLNCRYVIVGHSERRQYYGETNELVAEKCQAALSNGLTPILCVGETLEQREQNLTLEVVREQLAVVLQLVDNLAALATAVVAYEPVWAIGTGQHATPEQAQDVHAALREQLIQHDASLEAMRILYGGSVKPNNAADLFAMPDIDGALVGGASLDAQQFLEIGKQCNP